MLKILITFMLICSYELVFGIETVKSVDLKRTMGTWYEIASIPNKWQADCYKNTKSVYTPNKNGSFDLTKSCIKKNGRGAEISGEGNVVNKETNAEYKVSFVPLLHLFGWFTGQYKMLLVDPDYRFAVVGEDNMEYGWIMARQHSIHYRDLAMLESQIRQMGYDSCKFLITIQERGPYQESKPLCEVAKH